MYKLIDLIEILSSNYKIQISINGAYVGTFDSGDDFPYRYLILPVKCLYPGTIHDNHSKDSTETFKPIPVTRIDLIDKK